MNFNITKKISDKWHVFAKIEPNKFDDTKMQMNISLSNAKKLVTLIEQEGKEFKGEKYLYIPVFESTPKKQDGWSETKTNQIKTSNNLDDEILF